MKRIEEGIVFSNDIKTILDGKNALDFSYQANGLVVPSKTTINCLRKSFLNETRRLFNNLVTIISEEQMQESIIESLRDVYKVYPHCLTR